MLHVQCFPQGVILAEGEFSDFESSIIGAPLEITNKYMEAVSYFSVREHVGVSLSLGSFHLLLRAVDDVLFLKNGKLAHRILTQGFLAPS